MIKFDKTRQKTHTHTQINKSENQKPNFPISQCSFRGTPQNFAEAHFSFVPTMYNCFSKFPRQFGSAGLRGSMHKSETQLSDFRVFLPRNSAEARFSFPHKINVYLKTQEHKHTHKQKWLRGTLLKYKKKHKPTFPLF